MVLEANISPNLAQALEKISQWAGDGNKADFPSGPPATELVEAFDRAMSGVDAGTGTMEAVNQAGVENQFPITAPEYVPDAGVTGRIEPEGMSQKKLISELSRLLEKVSAPGGQFTMNELYRVQFLVGMIGVNVKSGINTSQQVSGAVENMLRQDG